MTTLAPPLPTTHPLTPEELARLGWSGSHVGEAFEALAQQAGLLNERVAPAAPPVGQLSEAWIAALAAQLGIEAEPVTCTLTELDRLLRNAGPALLPLTLDQAKRPVWLALVRAKRRHVLVLTPERRLVRVRRAQLVTHMRAPHEAAHHALADQVLVHTAVRSERRDAVRQALIEMHSANTTMTAGWLIRPPLNAKLRHQVRYFGLTWPALRFIGLVTFVQTLTLLTWGVLGQAVLSHSVNWAQLSAWALLLVTMIPLQLWQTTTQRQLEVQISGLVKLRMLGATLGLAPDAVRHQGSGSFFGLVVDAENLDDLLTTGGLGLFSALSQLVSAAGLLALGAVGLAHAGLLGLWILLIFGLLGLVALTDQRSFQAHRALSSELIEAMGGQRTRLAQEARATWHQQEDRQLSHYLRMSLGFDHASAALEAGARSWTFAGLLAVAPAMLAGTEPSLLAVSLAGVVLAQQGLYGLANTGESLVAALTFARQLRAQGYHTGQPVRLPPAVVPPPTRLKPGQTLLSAQGLVYRYRPEGPPALKQVSLRVAVGDRLLITGPSGGGKSTLAAVLAGSRHPEAGLLLLEGFDPVSLGPTGWRQRVALAPQFHENHIFGGSFAYNVLLGRRWPPTPADLAEAETICGELGLGDLLERMPGGMQQQIGETGWQLSHGERSRLFLARALVQGAPLIMLDESVGALDPETLHLALRCALQRAPALILIAHP